jgi:DNA-directed RNA polymerase specialized sigma24 family protein
VQPGADPDAPAPASEQPATHPSVDLGSQTDEQLVSLAAGGDRAALEAFFDRHFDAVYDFAVRAVREPLGRLTTTLGAFTDFWDASIRQAIPIGNITARLFAAARDNAIIASRHPQRPAEGTSTPDQPDPSLFSVPESAGLNTGAPADTRQEFASAVWDAASSLTTKQYTLLDMHLRRGLTPEKMADGLRRSGEDVYVMVSRLRNSLYESVMLLMLMRRGRDECEQLDSLLSKSHVSELDRRAHETIHSHLKTCEVCRASRSRYGSPLDVFARLALVPAPPDVKTRVWQNLSAHTQDLAPQRGAVGVALGHVDDRSRLPLIIAAAGGLTALVILVLAAFLFLDSGGGGATLSDPENVRAGDRELGDSSTDNVIEVIWDPQNNVQAYSVAWSEDAEELPDTDPDLAGSTTRTESPPLDPGIWYFHLRTQGTDGSWTSTVHLGPFEIVEDDEDRPSPTASPTPTPSVRPTQPVTPNFGTPPPPPTAAPTPVPTPAPTDTPPPVTPPPPTPTEPPATDTPIITIPPTP